MSTELTPQQSFEQRLEERLRRDIGELMPDEVLRDIVSKAMDKCFFAEREVIDRSGYRTETRIEPSWACKLIDELLKDSVKEAVIDWLSTHGDEVNVLIKERIGYNMSEFVKNLIDSLLNRPFADFQIELERRLTNR